VKSQVIGEPDHGEPIRDDRYGTVWELTPEATSPLQKLGVAYVTVDAGATSPVHFHSKTEEVYHVLAGDGSMIVEGQTFEIHEGSTVLIAVGERHAVRAGASGLKLLVSTAPPYDPEDDTETAP